MSDTEMPDLLPDDVLAALFDIRKAGWDEGHPMHRGTQDSDKAIADAISAIIAHEDAVRRSERARLVALVQSLHDESQRQELDTQADQLTSIMYGGRVTAFARLLDELDTMNAPAWPNWKELATKAADAWHPNDECGSALVSALIEIQAAVKHTATE